MKVLVVVLAVLTVLPSAAAADVEKGMQDDSTLVWWSREPDGLLETGKALGVTHVRLNAFPRRGLDRLDESVDRVRRHGMTPQVTIAADAPMTPGEYAEWVAAVVARVGDRVDRWSVWNEPDLSIDVGDDCDPLVASRVVRLAGYSVRSSTGYRIVRYRKTRVRMFRKRGQVVRKKVGYLKRRRVRVTTKLIVPTSASGLEDSVTVENGCRAINRGREYRRYVLAATPVIRWLDPGAEILIGETSPHPQLPLLITELFRHGPLDVDGYAHHPYTFGKAPDGEDTFFNVDDTPDLQRLLARVSGERLPIYWTEFGYFVPDDPFRGTPAWLAAAYWGRLFQMACDYGVRQVLAYQWDRPPEAPGEKDWNTALLAPGRAPTPASIAFGAAGGC